MMAMPLPGYGHGNRRRSLTCGVCQDIFRSPRLLPCFHSFCLDCVEGLIRTHSPSFPCPQCRKPTPVPRNGALGFQLNFYISEEELELERNGPQTVPCPHHGDPLLFFCVPCDQPICLRCKLTKHDHHETQDLSEAAARCGGDLEASRDRLEEVISRLSKISTDAYDNIEAVKLKESALIEEVQAKRNAVVAKVDQWCLTVVGDVQQCSQSISTQLTEDAKNIQQRLDSLLQLRQRVDLALGSASDVEKVRMEKEMREGEGSEEELGKVQECVPSTTTRPVLHCDPSVLTDDTIHRWLGSAARLSFPFAATGSEVISPIYRSSQGGSHNEIRNVCHVNENRIMFSITAPNSTQEQVQCINDKGRQLRRFETDKRQMCFHNYPRRMLYHFSRGLIAEDEIHLECKGRQRKVISYHKTGKRCHIGTGSSGLYNPIRDKFSVNCELPKAFGVTEDEQMFVVVEEKRDVLFSGTPQLTVLLFRHGKRQPFTTYKPSSSPHFHPTDVCFWREDKQVKLLVADKHNDSVHVVRIEDTRCCFERYLAAGNGNLVRPTSLAVDDQGHVWIGCGNGWILKCETLPGKAESHVASGCGSEESVSGSPGLHVDNVSDFSDTVSPMSTD